jgi:hypothetical protein
MGYTERLVIGIIITVWGYSLLHESKDRQYFHQALSQLFSILHHYTDAIKIQECYCCIDTLRIAFVALIFSAGATLVLGISTDLAIAAEILLLVLDGVRLIDGVGLREIEPVLVHSLLLIVLIANCYSLLEEEQITARKLAAKFKSESKAAAASEAKVAVEK